MHFIMQDEKYRKIETTCFGKIIILDDVDDLFTIANLLTSFDAHTFSFVGWRGQASLNWYIDSKAVRRLKLYHLAAAKAFDDSIHTFNSFLGSYEEKLLQRARQRGHGYYFGRSLYDLELLSLIQHYGGATRLLDFSKNMWIALWFACMEQEEEDGLLVCLNIDRLNNSMAHIKEGLTSLKLEKILEIVPKHPIIYEPMHLIPRMKNQHSFFVFGNAVNESWGSIPVYSSEDLTFIGISSKLKKSLNLLWKPLFGFDETYIYDDLEGFSQSHNSNRSIDFEFQTFG